MPAAATVLLVNEDPYAIRACVAGGRPCVLVHGPGLAESGYIDVPDGVETVFAENVSSVESLLAALTRAGMRERAFGCVMTSDEEALVATAALGTVLGAPSADADVALLFRDKWLQKQMVGGAGVPVARSLVIDDLRNVDPALADAFPAAVLKPIASGGTQLTSVVRSSEDLIAASAAATAVGTPMRTFVLEEFVEGAEWVVNGVVAGGSVRFAAVGLYSSNCLAAVSARSAVQVQTLDPDEDSGAYARVMPVVEVAVSALGLQAGVFHMELFVPDDGPVVFGECAARRGGGMTHEVVEEKFGIDLGAAAVACALGLQPELDVELNPHVIGSTSLVSPPGLLVQCPTAADLAALPGVLCSRIDLPWGSQVGETLAGTFQRAGQVLVTGETAAQFRERRDAAVRWFAERVVVVPPHASPAQLRAWQETNWPGTVERFAPFARREIAATA